LQSAHLLRECTLRQPAAWPRSGNWSAKENVVGLIDTGDNLEFDKNAASTGLGGWTASLQPAALVEREIAGCVQRRELQEIGRILAAWLLEAV